MPTYTIYIAAALILFLSVIFFLRRKRRGGGSRPGSAAGSETGTRSGRASTPMPSRSEGSSAKKKIPEFPQTPIPYSYPEISEDDGGGALTSMPPMPSRNEGSNPKKGNPEFPEAPMSKAYAESSDAYPGSDDVALGISSPGCVKPAQSFTIKFVAYPEKKENEIKQLLHELDPENKVLLNMDYCQWQRGTEIVVRLYSDHLEVKEEIQKFIWLGKHKILSFDAVVLKDAPVGEYANVKTDVLIAGIVIAKLRHSIKIDNNCSTAGDEKFVKGQPYKTAFASYSRKDTNIVVGRLSEIERNGVKVFYDKISLETNEQWKVQLDKAIKDTQVFMLFWSSNAKTSETVDWEWRTAFKYKGLKGIEPHPLEDPETSPPPEELKELHFDDKYLYFQKNKK